jgi:phosphatidylglycerol lysyltransferase
VPELSDYQRTSSYDEVVAFLVASPVPARQGWLVEQIVRSPHAPNGTNELLVDTAFRDLAALGSRWVTLGLAPLSVRARFAPGDMPRLARPRPLMRFVLGWVRAHARRFYDFDGLDAWKAKLQPHGWEPIWAITSEKRVTLRTLYAIAGAFSGTSPVLFVARALARAVVQEARWLLERWGR